MTAWVAAAWVFALAVAVCGGAALTGGRWERLLALQLAGTAMALLWMALAVVGGQPLLLGLALAVAIAGGLGTLVFTRLLGESGR